MSPSQGWAAQLLASAARQPGAIAFVERGRLTNYDDAATKMRGFAAGIYASGLKRGDHARYETHTLVDKLLLRAAGRWVGLVESTSSQVPLVGGDQDDVAELMDVGRSLLEDVTDTLDLRTQGAEPSDLVTPTSAAREWRLSAGRIADRLGHKCVVRVGQQVSGEWLALMAHAVADKTGCLHLDLPQTNCRGEVLLLAGAGHVDIRPKTLFTLGQATRVQRPKGQDLRGFAKNLPALSR